MGNPTGAWKCPQCGFVLMKRVISAQSGSIGVDRRADVEPCPNDGTAMRMIPPDDMVMTDAGKIDLVRTGASRLRRAWLDFDRDVIPRDAPELQRTEMQRAFYVGAHSLLTEMVKMLDLGEEPTEADLAKMDEIRAEIDRFYSDVAEGKA